MKQAAGTLLYREVESGVEVLLVHPAGNYNRHAPWSIPKGQLNPQEHFEEAARRETLEETGVVAGDLVEFGHIEYTRSRKRVYCFAGQAPKSARPACTSPEVDRAEFVPLNEAMELIHPDQLAFLKRLAEFLS